jgi:hypothetical protein
MDAAPQGCLCGGTVREGDERGRHRIEAIREAEAAREGQGQAQGSVVGE